LDIAGNESGILDIIVDGSRSETTGGDRLDLKIIRLAKRRMLITSKPKPRIVPIFQRQRIRLGVSYRKKK
jgi:hypothetical protein